jgi:voltage-gated potassium channel
MEGPMRWKEHVESALDGRHPGLGHYVELFLDAIIILSTVAMGVETLPGLPYWGIEALRAFEFFVVAVFTVEYALRLLTTPAPLGYARSFFGMVDLLAIAPFYIALLLTGTHVDLRAVRVLRLLRLARLLKLARYTTALDRFGVAWRAVREEVIVFGIAAVVVLYVCALVIYQCEHDAQPDKFRSVFDAMWWAAVTLTTVGYGDIYPITPIGRLFTVFMLFVALGIIAVPTGLVASALVAIRHREDEQERKEKAEEEARKARNATRGKRGKTAAKRRPAGKKPS